jgi:hypothetical protein
MTDQPKPSPIVQLGMFAMLCLGGWYAYQWFFDSGMSDIERQVADDAIKQYGIVKRQGSQIERCAHAGMVTAALLQAKDEERYAHWKKTEAEDCARAGVPR